MGATSHCAMVSESFTPFLPLTLIIRHFDTKFTTERFNVAIYDAIQKGIVARDGEVNEELDGMLLKRAWMKVVLMEFDPKGRSFAAGLPSVTQSQRPRRQQAQTPSSKQAQTPSSNSKKKTKPLFTIDHKQPELRREIETRVLKMIGENKSLDEELKNDMIGKGVIPKQANWFYFDQVLSGGIAKYPRSKALKLIILTGEGGEAPTQLGDVIEDGELHAKIADLIAKGKLKPKKVNPVQKRQKKSDNNDKSEGSE